MHIYMTVHSKQLKPLLKPSPPSILEQAQQHTNKLKDHIFASVCVSHHLSCYSANNK